MYVRFLVLALAAWSAMLSAQSPELVIPGNHGYDLNAVAASPDAKWLATSSSNQIKLWDYPSGRLVKTFDISGASAFTNTIEYVAFSNDGRYLAAPNGERLSIIDLGALRIVDQQNLRVQDVKNFAVGAISSHPTRPEFYFHLRYNGKEHLMRYIIPDRKLVINAEWEKFQSNDVRANLISWNPSGNQAMVANHRGFGGAVVDIMAGTASAYAGALAWLPDGNLLAATRYASSVELRAAKPDGTVLWRRSFREQRYGSQKFLRNNLAIDAVNERFYFAADDEFMISGNYRTGTDVRESRKPGGAGGAPLATGPDGHLIVTNNGPIWVAEARADGSLRKFGTDVMAVNNVATDPGSLRFAVSSQSGLNRLVELTPRGPATAFKGQTDGTNFVKIAPGGRFMATHYRDAPVFWGSTQTGTFRKIVPAIEAVRNVALDGAGNLAVLGGSGVAYYRSGATTPAWVTPHPMIKYPTSYSYSAVFSPDGKTLYAMDHDGEDYRARAFSTADGRVLWTAAVWIDDLVVSADGKEIIGTSGLSQIIRLNARSGKVIERKTRTDGQHFRAGFNERRTLLLGGDKNTKGSNAETITVVDVATGRKQTNLAGHTSGVQSKGYLRDELALSSGFDNTVRLWNTRSGNELAKLFFFVETDDWVVAAPDGRFDATPGALSQLYYRVGTQLVPLEQFYESFYTPGLLGMLMDGTAPAAPAVQISAVAPPPTVSIAFRQGTRNLVVEDDATSEEITAQNREANIVVRARAPEGRVAEIRLFHNGKLLGNFRGLGVEDDPVRENERTYPVTLLPGENTFRAVALNDQRTESAPALLLVNYTAPAAPPEEKNQSGITLHLLTVGINEYKNPRYNLNYAEADAGGIENAVKTGLNGIVSRTQLHTIRNAGATRGDILAAIAAVTQQAGANDVFVFYYAGHGVMSEGATKDFFLVPHDVTQLYGNDAGLAAKGISATELKALAAGIPAQKQLYILDACQSAGAVQSIALRGAAEEKAIAQLARSTGTHWLTASGSEQFASEFDQLGHGAFTYVLLEALNGKAAGGDGRVTVNELKAYLDRVVPEITEKYNGQAQYPASYGFGQDFPVSVQR